jgi:hypothetical protein
MNPRDEKLLAIRGPRDTSTLDVAHEAAVVAHKQCFEVGTITEQTLKHVRRRITNALRGQLKRGRDDLRPHRSRSCVRQSLRQTVLLLRGGQVNTTGVRTAVCFPLDQCRHQAAEYRDRAIECQRHHRSSFGLIKDLLLCLDHLLVFQERHPECLELFFDQSRVGKPHAIC